MNPHIRLMLQQVWPLFWPWLFWNLARAADWQKRTGRDALIAVDRFGNIHFLVLSDAPKPDDLYSYEAPRVPRWGYPALGSDVPANLCATLIWSAVTRILPRLRGRCPRSGRRGLLPQVRSPPPSAGFAVCHLPRERGRMNTSHS